MTKEELLNKTGHSLSMKDLRRFVENNKDIPDSAPCMIERITDYYFTSREWHDGQTIEGWDVLKVEGYDYHSALAHNKNMLKEMEIIKNGGERQFRMDNPEEHIFGKKELEKMKEEFYQPHCISTDKEVIYIYSHY